VNLKYTFLKSCFFPLEFCKPMFTRSSVQFNGRLVEGNASLTHIHPTGKKGNEHFHYFQLFAQRTYMIKIITIYIFDISLKTDDISYVLKITSIDIRRDINLNLRPRFDN
jgi:hypothetical protein